LKGNYRNKDMPRYDLNIAIFDTIRYIVPSLLSSYFDSQHFDTVVTIC